VLLDHIVDLWGVHEGLNENVLSLDVILRNGVVLQRGPERMQALKARLQDQGYRLDNDKSMERAEPELAVHWLAPMTYINRVKSPYISNDGMIEHAYGDAGLFVEVPPFGEGIRALNGGPGFAGDE
jgi:hypothetical protein